MKRPVLVIDSILTDLLQCESELTKTDICRLNLIKSEQTYKNNTQTAVINIINLRIIYKLDVSYASQHTFSKVTVTIF